MLRRQALIIIGTSDEILQNRVIAEYTKTWFGFFENKAVQCIKNKDEELALNYFKIICPNVSDIGRAYIKLAELYSNDANGFSEAITSYETALTYSEKSKYADSDLINIYEGIGFCAMKIPDFKKAEKSFLKTNEIAQKTNDNAQIGLSHYDLAGLYTATKEKEKAYKNLEKAFILDNKWVKSALADPLFKDLQKEERFKGLVKKYLIE